GSVVDFLLASHKPHTFDIVRDFTRRGWLPHSWVERGRSSPNARVARYATEVGTVISLLTIEDALGNVETPPSLAVIVGEIKKECLEDPPASLNPFIARVYDAAVAAGRYNALRWIAKERGRWWDVMSPLNLAERERREGDQAFKDFCADVDGAVEIAENATMQRAELSRNASNVSLRPGGAAAAGSGRQMCLATAEELDSLSATLADDPAAVVQFLPDIMHAIESFCISSPESCSMVWGSLKALLDDIHKVVAENQEREKARPKSPIAAPKPFVFKNVHDEEWQDDYAWLTDRDDPDVLSYIDAENQYSLQSLEHTKPLQRLLYKEFVSRLDESEETVRVTLSDGHTYFTKKVPGEEYRQHCRVLASGGGDEEVYLDENALARGEGVGGGAEAPNFFKLGFLKHSPNCKMIAYGVDWVGNERNTTYFMMLDTKENLPDIIEGVYEDLEFSTDGDYVFYTLLDDCERAYQLKRHKLGTSVTEDVVLYHEEDEMFFLSLTKSSNGKYIILNSAAQITSETRYVPADSPLDDLMVLMPRREHIQYKTEAHDNSFYVLTNEDSKNNWLFRIPIPTSTTTQDELLALRESVIEHRDFVLIEDFQLHSRHLIVFERSNCLQNVRVIDLTAEGFNTYHYVSFSETVYSLLPRSVDEEVADLSKAVQYDTGVLRFTYTSFIQPKQVVDYDMVTRTMTVVEEEKVGGPFPYDPSLYISKRLFATGVDGTAIPVSIVYRRDLLGANLPVPQPNPLLLHAYGAYGTCVNPMFSASRISLLDRGFVYAVAHVRGGADMGNGWYEEGKLGKKPNTFLDFISVAEYLCKEGYTTPSKLGIYGRSAGGLLIGAVINMRPDLFRAALTEVPFVDVINTMFDSSIPWTAFEYEEWGNPNDYDIYQVMKTYCPYTNMRADLLANNEYPHLLVVGGMNDPRVAFFEPLKLVAKMRNEKRKYLAANPPTVADESSRDKRLLLLKVDEAGHGGNSGQYSYLEDLAVEYAFLVSTLCASPRPIALGSLPSSLSLNFNASPYEYLDGMSSPTLFRRSTHNTLDVPLQQHIPASAPTTGGYVGPTSAYGAAG
ncbi:hypothetical protein HK101_004262, partial [Irineochytrium annulatum]